MTVDCDTKYNSKDEDRRGKEGEHGIALALK